MVIHVTVMTLTEPSPEGEMKRVFASLDGKSYLPVTREPTAEDGDRIASLFEGDGNFKPMRYARRAMNAWWWPESAAVGSFDHYTVG